MRGELTAGQRTPSGSDLPSAVCAVALERRLAALDPLGNTGHFTGANSIAVADVRTADHVSCHRQPAEHSTDVLGARLDGSLTATGSLRTLVPSDALDAASRAGGDSRGLRSAALLVVSRAQPPMTLRVDYSETPLTDLRALHSRATSGLYGDWVRHVPTLDDPQRSAPFSATKDPVTPQ